MEGSLLPDKGLGPTASERSSVLASVGAGMAAEPSLSWVTSRVTSGRPLPVGRTQILHI